MLLKVVCGTFLFVSLLIGQFLLLSVSTYIDTVHSSFHYLCNCMYILIYIEIAFTVLVNNGFMKTGMFTSCWCVSWHTGYEPPCLYHPVRRVCRYLASVLSRANDRGAGCLQCQCLLGPTAGTGWLRLLFSLSVFRQ